MYSKIAKAARHEIQWNAKPTFSSASVISETLYVDKIDYFFFFPLLQWSSFFGVLRFFDMNVGGLRTKLPPVFFGFFAPALTVMRPDFLAWRK